MLSASVVLSIAGGIRYYAPVPGAGTTPGWDPAAQAAKYQADTSPIQVSRPQGRPLAATFVGDSLTAGSFSTSDSTSFRGVMTAAWGKDGPVAAGRFAKSGATAEAILGELPAPAPAADVIVVEAGTNDAARHTDPTAFSNTYGRLLDALRVTSPRAGLLCAGAWGDSGSVASTDRMIERICTERGGRFVPLYSSFESTGTRGPDGARLPSGAVIDGFHPNDAGHAAIAQQLLGHISLT